MMIRINIFNIIYLIVLIMCPIETWANHNYVRTSTYLDENGGDAISTVAYYDQWGRVDETMAGGFSTTGRYLESKTEYDNMGRPVLSWVPFPSQGASYAYDESLPQHAQSCFSDSYAYSSTGYDALGRIIRSTMPGTAFQSHYATTTYGFNRSSHNIHKYSTSGNSAGVASCGNYNDGELSVVTTSDPDGKMTTVYTDKLGRKVMERHGSNNDTYYVYNEKSQLRYVLQPMYQENADLDKYSFQYEYDGLGRCQMKKLPGCDPVSYQYDSADRVISMQDGVLSGQSKHRVLEYDGLGRVTRQRISGGSTASYDEIVNYYDSYDFLDAQTEYSTAVRALLAPSSEQYSDCQLTGSKQRASNGELILTVFEYDDFGRIIRQAEVGLNKRISVTTFEYNFWGGVTKESTKTYKTRTDGTCHAASEFEIIRKYEGQHTKLLTSALLIIRKDETGTMCNDSIIIQHPTYDDFGRMTYDDRSGTAADMQYSYDNMHGWLTQVRSVGGFEQNIYRETGSSQHYYNGSIAAMSWKMAGSNSVNHYSYTYDEMNRLTQAQYSLTVGGAIVHPLLQNLIPQNSGFSMENYGEQVTYDKNSNITSLKRYGMLNSRSYGLIDNLYIDHTGNQLKKVDDLILSRLTYSGASDFVDGSNTDVEYTYDANGSLTKDQNRGISSIEYDLLGNIRKIIFSNGNTTQYIYSADGRRLRTIHYSLTIDDSPIFRSIGTPGIAPFGRRDSIENIGNLILKNGHPSQYLFDGGYASFNADTFDDWHYYIQDYMGNVRMVVNSDGTVEQQNHYYPYGGIIGNLSTNQDLQTFKFESKELDRKFGLDWYDIHARQYDAIGVPSWNKPDALAEENPHLSPYAFAGGNPVNFGDYDGLDYWSTSDPEQIQEFLDNYRYSGTIESSQFESWSLHETDKDFLSKLTYNDETRYAYYTNFETINNEAVLNCTVFKPLDYSDFASGFAGALTWSVQKGVKTKNEILSKIIWDSSLREVGLNHPSRIYKPIKATAPVIKTIGTGLSIVSSFLTISRIRDQHSIGVGDVFEAGVDICGFCPVTSYIPVLFFVTDTGYRLLSNGHSIVDDLNQIYKFDF